MDGAGDDLGRGDDMVPGTVEGDERVFRVTVRGRFANLTDRARRYLVGARAEHDIFESAFTTEGTFTYDDRIQFFNLRYEVRARGTDASAAAGATGRAEATTFLDTMGFGYTGLRVQVSDMTAMWDDATRRRA